MGCLYEYHCCKLPASGHLDADCWSYVEGMCGQGKFIKHTDKGCFSSELGSRSGVAVINERQDGFVSLGYRVVRVVNRLNSAMVGEY